MRKARRRSLVRGVLALIAGGSAICLVEYAQAADFYAIISNLTEVKKPGAYIDVAVDTAGGPVNVQFDVFRIDGTLASEFVLPTDSDGFVSSASAVPPSGNLFTAAGGSPALVRIRTPDTADNAAAVLHHTLNRARFLFGVPPGRRADGSALAIGRFFSTVLGDIAHPATLLIGNVSANDANVDVFLGTRGVTGAGKYTNPRLQPQTAWRVDINPADASSNLVIVSSAEVVAQLVVDQGKKNLLAGVALVPHF